MAIVEGKQICIPVGGQGAMTVIGKMQSLLDARRTQRVSRRVFLRQWKQLRLALFMTGDYQRLRERITNRCNGICEICFVNAMAHVHHIEPVAFNPKRALLDDNCKAVCRKCHRAEHAA